MRQRLSAAQVAELAELLEDAPRRAGVVEEVLQAAAEGRGMTLLLTDQCRLPGRPAKAGAGCGPAGDDIESGRQR
jgi:hypothetical protein